MNVKAKQLSKPDEDSTFDWVHIPGGSFLMGSSKKEKGRTSDEQLHVVHIEPFWMMDTPVTFAMYDCLCETHFRSPTPKDNGWGREERPVINVSWGQVVASIWVLNMEPTQWQVRLPTEAEWEYACKAGTNTRYSFGEEILPSQANYDHGSGALNQTVPVKSYPPNAWGLYDMHGNVSEWTGSLYNRDYDGSELIDGSDISRAKVRGQRAVRGGSCWSQEGGLRSASRVPMDENEESTVGFRLVYSEAGND